MTENTMLTNDDLLLLRWLAGETTAQESAEVEQRLRSDSAFAGEALRYRRLDELLSTWKEGAIRCDDEGLRASIAGALADPAKARAHADERALDRVLSSWADVSVETDWDSFHAGVMKGVAQARQGRRRPHLLFRLAAPLAAAAAIGLVATVFLWDSSPSVEAMEVARRVEIGRVADEELTVRRFSIGRMGPLSAEASRALSDELHTGDHGDGGGIVFFSTGGLDSPST